MIEQSLFHIQDIYLILQIQDIPHYSNIELLDHVTVSYELLMITNKYDRKEVKLELLSLHYNEGCTLNIETLYDISVNLSLKVSTVVTSALFVSKLEMSD